MKKRKHTQFTLMMMAATFLALLSAFVLPQFFIQETQVETEIEDEAAHTHLSTELIYALDWNTMGVTLQDEILLLTNELGYQIEVHSGYLVTYSTELVPCAEGSMLDWMSAAFFPQTAHAGHGGDEPDFSKSTNIIVESLTAPQSTAMTPLPLNEASYCHLHYLVGPGADYATELVSDEFDEQSLLLSGVYYAPYSEVAMPFEIETDLAWGQLTAIEKLTLNGEPIRVTITRDLSSLFDGIVFEELDNAEAGMAVLRNLMDGLVVIVEK